MEKNEEQMPILGPRVPRLVSVPMRLLSENIAQQNHGQTLKRLKERGGLGVGEVLSIMHGEGWGKYANDKDAAQKVLDILDADLQSEVSRLEGLNRELVRLVDDLLLFAKLDGEIVNGFRTMDTVKELRALLSRASSKEETTN